MKKFLQLAVLFFIITYVPKFCEEKTDGFKICKIHSSLPYNPKWDVAKNPEVDVTEIFSQPFTYLASGGQCYAFVSQDQNYVVKFFKHHTRRLPFLINHLPLPKKLAAKREKQRVRRTTKLLRDYRSYKLAYEQLTQETGLLYVHLNKTDHLNCQAKIIDKIGVTHTLDLDQMEFVLQKKATLAYSHLEQLIKTKQLDKAKNAIASICDLIIQRCEKGIYDEDPRIHRNFGFLGEKPILIDVGRLKPDPSRKDPLIQQQDLKKITRRLSLYLEDLSPELAKYLDHHLEGRKDA